MKKNLFLFVALVSAFLWVSCSGGSKSHTTSDVSETSVTDSLMKEQVAAEGKITDTMQSIVKLCSSGHEQDYARIDSKIAELKKQVEDAKKLVAPEGHDAEMKTYRAFLDKADDFVRKVEKVQEKGEYSEADYEMLSGAYETSIN